MPIVRSGAEPVDEAAVLADVQDGYGDPEPEVTKRGKGKAAEDADPDDS